MSGIVSCGEVGAGLRQVTRQGIADEMPDCLLEKRVGMPRGRCPSNERYRLGTPPSIEQATRGFKDIDPIVHRSLLRANEH